MNKSEKILVVDDQAGIRLLLNDVLANEGYNVTTASTGKEAVEMMEENRFDLVILDYNLPVMNAEKVMEEMEKLKIQIPVILVTGLGKAENELERLKFVQKVMLKPFNIQDIRQEVHTILARE